MKLNKKYVPVYKKWINYLLICLKKIDGTLNKIYLSNDVDFQTKSTQKLWVHSIGAPKLLLSSIPTSSP